MKIADLNEVWQSKPRIVRASTETDIVHIVQRNGVQKGKYRDKRASISNCNRLMKWPNTERHWEDYRLCPQCGGKDHPKQTFLAAEEAGKEWDAREQAEQDQKRAMEQAEYLVNKTWDETWERLDQSIMDDVQELVDTGHTLVPLTREEIEYLKLLVATDVLTDKPQFVDLFTIGNRLLKNTLLVDK